MTIQIPNPGTGNGATGDNEFVLWSKVRDNFSNTTHAASRLIGVSTGNVPEMTTRGLGNTGLGATLANEATDIGKGLTYGVHRVASSTIPVGLPVAGLGSIFRTGWDSNSTADIYQPVNTINTALYIRSGLGQWYEVRTTRNTSVDANGFIKAASPIVKVFADKVELNDEAETQNVSYKKNGIGNYTITTQSGLSTDGWYIELPKDMNGNPKVAVTLEETDGVISLKSYKRIFSVETFTFEPDLDNPLDIPDTRWIDLRLNEIAVEMPDNIQTEV